MPESKSRRIPKPFWFGVAAVVMAVLAVFLQVWLPYHREQVVIREIERLGGDVLTIWDGPKWTERGPEWIQEIVDDGWLSWFERAYSVWISETAISDEVLRHLSGLTKLDTLSLQNTQVSDEELKHLRGLTNLQFLYLDNTQIGDEGLKSLTGLTNLENVSLNNTQIGGKGLKHLSGLQSLTELSLNYTQVTDEGLKHLSCLTNLEQL